MRSLPLQLYSRPDRDVAKRVRCSVERRLMGDIAIPLTADPNVTAKPRELHSPFVQTWLVPSPVD
jgi:hypothetical protein